MDKVFINGQEIKPPDVFDMQLEYESPYIEAQITINKEPFKILILREDKERLIKAFNREYNNENRRRNRRKN